MKLSLVSIEKEGFVRVAVEGNLVASEIDAVGNNPMAGLLGATWFNNRVVLDMKKCDYLDSSAIGWFMSCQKSFKQNGGQLVLHSVQPAVQQIFDLLKIGKVITITPDGASARTLITQGGAK